MIIKTGSDGEGEAKGEAPVLAEPKAEVFNPDVCLEEILVLARRITGSGDEMPDPHDAVELAERVLRLDLHMEAMGKPPVRWQYTSAKLEADIDDLGEAGLWE